MRADYIGSDMKIGKITIDKSYLERANVPSELLTKEALREQVMDLINTAYGKRQFFNKDDLFYFGLSILSFLWAAKHLKE